MTQVIFGDWLLELNKYEKTKQKNFIVDNATSENTTKILRNVTVQFLPSNLTSEIQPLDQGIVRQLKIGMNQLKTESREEFHKSITVLHTIRWLYCAWMDMSHETIKKCFHRAGFVSNGLANDIEERNTILTDTVHKFSNNFIPELATER